MPGIDTIEIYAADVEDVRHVLSACLVMLEARDIMEAQVALTNQRPSPLTLEVSRIKGRYDGYFGDFLLARHEASQEFDDPQDDDGELGPKEGAEELVEASEEPLADAPLGTPKVGRQRGRRLEADEV